MTSFISVDGEGVTHDDGTHDYVLLSVGNQSLHRNGVRLSFVEIMSFLYRHHQLNHRSAFVGFYLSYDFSHWLRDLPAEKAWLLLTDAGIAKRRKKSENARDPWPVRWNGWEFDILGMRRFKLRPMMEHYGQRNIWSWMYICDAGPFWQTGFLNAVNPERWSDPICTDEEYAIIKEGKKARSTAVFDPKMIHYNVTENRVLAKAMSALDKGFRSQGWKLSKDQWFGPGQVADKWLKSIGAPMREDIEKVTPPEVLDAGRCSYYGGWFEIPRHGLIPGTSYEYDINSAYPFIISQLPCLLHGRWSHVSSGDEWVDGGSEVDGYRLAYVRTSGNDSYLGGLPHRDEHGIITRPRETEGWYWWHEIRAAYRAGLIDSVYVRESWVYGAPVKCACRKPFRSIVHLYEQRLSIGKNTAAGIALKLVYNSSYGKFAQSVGSPKYANAIYASLITAGCRVMILDAIATHPGGSRDVLMVATDGVYFRTPHPDLPISDDTLGEWDSSTKSNLCLFMPGVYWDDKTRNDLRNGKDKITIKSRGINANELAECIGVVDYAFRGRFEDWPEVTVPIRFSVITPKLAMARGKWETCGRVVVHSNNDPHTKTLSSDPSNKRQYWPYLDNGILTTFPYQSKGITVGYNKRFGRELDDIRSLDEFVTDDNNVYDELMGMIHDD